MTRSSTTSAWVTWGLYLFSVTLIVYPLMDLLTTVWPPRVTDMAWRYGMLGLGAGYLQTPLLGIVLAMGVAYWQQQAGVLRFWSLLSLAATVAILIAIVTFGLDVLAMRELRPEEARAGVLVGGILQEVKYGAAAVVLALLGLGAGQMASGMGRSRSRAAGTGAGSPGSLRGEQSA